VFLCGSEDGGIFTGDGLRDWIHTVKVVGSSLPSPHGPNPVRVPARSLRLRAGGSRPRY